MDDHHKPDAQNTVEYGDSAINDRTPDGRFGPGNTFASAQRGRPKGTRRLLREMMRDSLERAGGQALIERLFKESPLDMLKILARLEPKQVAVEDARQQVVMVMLPEAPPPDWSPPIASDSTGPDDGCRA